MSGSELVIVETDCEPVIVVNGYCHFTVVLLTCIFEIEKSVSVLRLREYTFLSRAAVFIVLA